MSKIIVVVRNNLDDQYVSSKDLKKYGFDEADAYLFEAGEVEEMRDRVGNLLIHLRDRGIAVIRDQDPT